MSGTVCSRLSAQAPLVACTQSAHRPVLKGSTRCSICACQLRPGHKSPSATGRAAADVPVSYRDRSFARSRVRAQNSSGMQRGPGHVEQSTGKKKVLFVCLGNICRSPSAEAVFKSVVDRAGLANTFFIDSCGTGGGNPGWYKEGGWSYHEGDPSDPRMSQAAQRRGITLTSRSRPLTPEDLLQFDRIIAMDQANVGAIQMAEAHWQQTGRLPANVPDKVELMCDYLRDAKFKGVNEVPDPYYGGRAGFDKVLDLLDDACEGLLAAMLQANATVSK